MPDEETPRRTVDITNTEQHLKLRNKYTQTKMERDKAQAEREELKTLLAQRDAELAQIRPQLDQNTLLKENRTLKGQVRDMRHQAVADRHLRELGIRPDAIEAFHKLAPFEAQSDDPDEEAVKAHVTEAKAKYGYLFGETKAEGETPTPTPTPAPGRGQGGKAGSNGMLRITSAQAGDDAWVYANQKQYQEAIRNKTLEIVD
jgi:hypothetical protein